MQILKILSKKTIFKVRGGGGQRSMVKYHTFALLNFGTLPLGDLLIYVIFVNWPRSGVYLKIEYGLFGIFTLFLSP